MAVDMSMEFSRGKPSPLVRSRPTLPAGKPRMVAMVPPRRPSIVSAAEQNSRSHMAMMEARSAAKDASANLQASASALAMANAENDRLAKRVNELEDELAKLEKMSIDDISALKVEIVRLNKLLDGKRCSGDCQKSIELLNRCHEFLGMLCRDGRCDDHCSACLGASDLADDVWDVLPHDPPAGSDAASAPATKGKRRKRAAKAEKESVVPQQDEANMDNASALGDS